MVYDIPPRQSSLVARCRGVVTELTNFFWLIVLDDLGQLHVTSDHGYLVRRLVRVIQTVFLGTSEQQLAYT